MTDSKGLVGGMVDTIATIARKKVEAYTQDRKHARVDYVIYKPDGDALAKVGAMVEAGHIKPDIDSVFDLENIREAHQRLESGRACGKIVINMIQK